MKTSGKGYMSGLSLIANRMSLQGFSRSGLAETWARHSASPEGQIPDSSQPIQEQLGAPLSIREAAKIIGCSPWTVRQSHLPNGLPHFRSGPNGKLIFYRDQVVAWILSQQRKGKPR